MQEVEALEEIIDLVVLDVGLPGTDGWRSGAAPDRQPRDAAETHVETHDRCPVRRSAPQPCEQNAHKESAGHLSATDLSDS